MACIPHIPLPSLLLNWIPSLFYSQDNSSSVWGTEEEQGGEGEAFPNPTPSMAPPRSKYLHTTEKDRKGSSSVSTDIKVLSGSLSETHQAERKENPGFHSFHYSASELCPAENK